MKVYMTFDFRNWLNVMLNLPGIHSYKLDEFIPAVGVTKPNFSLWLFFQISQNYQNTGYLYNIMSIIWQESMQLRCEDAWQI